MARNLTGGEGRAMGVRVNGYIAVAAQAIAAIAVVAAVVLLTEGSWLMGM